VARANRSIKGVLVTGGVTKKKKEIKPGNGGSNN